MRRELLETVQELKQAVALSRREGSGGGGADGRIGYAAADTAFSNGYDDGGFFNYSGGGREMRPAGGWLGGGGGSPPAGAAFPAAMPWSATAVQAAPSGTGSTAPSPDRSRDSQRPLAAVNGAAVSASVRQPDASSAITGPASAMLQPAVAGGDSGDNPVYPQSFHDVMQMVSKGITPPNVRTDINDKPPDPTRALSEPRSKPLLKPWERPSGDAASALASEAAPSAAQWAALALPPAADGPAVGNGKAGPVGGSSGPGWNSTLPRVGGPTGAAKAEAPVPEFPAGYSPAKPSTYRMGAGGISSIYAAAEAASPDRSSGPPEPAATAETSTLSVLQPLVAMGSASWKPPSLPQATLPPPSSRARAGEDGAASATVAQPEGETGEGGSAGEGRNPDVSGAGSDI